MQGRKRLWWTQGCGLGLDCPAPSGVRACVLGIRAPSSRHHSHTTVSAGADLLVKVNVHFLLSNHTRSQRNHNLLILFLKKVTTGKLPCDDSLWMSQNKTVLKNREGNVVILQNEWLSVKQLQMETGGTPGLASSQRSCQAAGCGRHTALRVRWPVNVLSDKRIDNIRKPVWLQGQLAGPSSQIQGPPWAVASVCSSAAGERKQSLGNDLGHVNGHPGTQFLLRNTP